jgi:hypothetical protein
MNFTPVHLAKSVSKETALPAIRDQDWLEAKRKIRKDQALRLGKSFLNLWSAI